MNAFWEQFTSKDTWKKVDYLISKHYPGSPPGPFVGKGLKMRFGKEDIVPLLMAFTIYGLAMAVLGALIWLIKGAVSGRS